MLPASGQIAMSQVNTELLKYANTLISLNDSAVRTLAGKASGAISLNDLHGKSNYTGPATIDVLVVAGGGGGAGHYLHDPAYFEDFGGAGGAGGMCEQSGRSISAGTTYTITVGAGGSGVAMQSGNNGSNSIFDTITALGGGGGAYGGVDGKGGGSGGGGGYTIDYEYGDEYMGYGGSATQGNSGGAIGYGHNGTHYIGGGAGSDGNSGGAGRANSITGSSITYASGGLTNGSSNAPANTGNGAYARSNSSTGFSGGSGVVIVRYPNTYTTASATTGSPTYTNSGGYHIYKFTGSGTIRF